MGVRLWARAATALLMRVLPPQYPEIFDVRIRPRVITSQTGTKDLQQVTVQLRILSRPREEELPEIFRKLGKDFDERVLPSICNEVLKATVVRGQGNCCVGR